MHENEEKVVEDNKNLKWEDVLDLVGNLMKFQNGQTIASETIGEMKKESKRRNFDMAVLGLLSAVVIVGLMIVNYSHAQANERNNQRWIEYLSQYDFVSQDGQGYNYYNSDVGGDVINGAENPQEAE